VESAESSKPRRGRAVPPKKSAAGDKATTPDTAKPKKRELNKKAPLPEEESDDKKDDAEDETFENLTNLEWKDALEDVIEALLGADKRDTISEACSVVDAVSLKTVCDKIAEQCVATKINQVMTDQKLGLQGGKAAKIERLARHVAGL
jgi:hypothetical protein